MAQWIRRLPTEQEIHGSSPCSGMWYFLALSSFYQSRAAFCSPPSPLRPAPSAAPFWRAWGGDCFFSHHLYPHLPSLSHPLEQCCDSVCPYLSDGRELDLSRTSLDRAEKTSPWQPLLHRRPRQYDSDCTLCSAPPATGPQRRDGRRMLAIGRNCVRRSCWARRCSVRWPGATERTTA